MAFWSVTDDQAHLDGNENDRFHGVLGLIKNPEPAIKISYTKGKVRFDVPYHFIFEEPNWSSEARHEKNASWVAHHEAAKEKPIMFNDYKYDWEKYREKWDKGMWKKSDDKYHRGSHHWNEEEEEESLWYFRQDGTKIPTKKKKKNKWSSNEFDPYYDEWKEK